MHFPSSSGDSVSTLTSKANQVIRSVNDLMTRYPIGTSYEKRDDFVGELFVLPERFNSILRQLKSKQMSVAEAENVEAIHLQFKETMRLAVLHGEGVRTPPSQYVDNVRKQMIAMLPKDEGTRLNSFIRNMSSSNSSADIDYTLRNAANLGAVKCLAILCGPYPKRAFADIFSEGTLSNKIAMHAAIEKGHANCVEILLNTMGPGDGRAPVQQLLYGQAPNRPIDSLIQLKDDAKCIAICDVILAHDLDDYYSDSPERRMEVMQIVAALMQERLELQATQSSGPGFENK